MSFTEQCKSTAMRTLKSVLSWRATTYSPPSASQCQAAQGRLVRHYSPRETPRTHSCEILVSQSDQPYRSHPWLGRVWRHYERTHLLVTLINGGLLLLPPLPLLPCPLPLLPDRDGMIKSGNLSHSGILSPSLPLCLAFTGL